jgi:hypothetical protein
MDLLLVLALAIILVVTIWTLVLLSRLSNRPGTAPAATPPTQVPRGVISTGDLALVIGSPGAPGFPIDIPEPPDPDGDCILALKLTPLTLPVSSPRSYEFEVVCFGAVCQGGERDCQLVWRRLGASPETNYRPAGTHLTEAVDVPIVWACGCGFNPEDIPVDCKAVIQTSYNPTAPTAYPLTGLVVDCDTTRCRSGNACALVQNTHPVTGVRYVWCQCLS